MAKILQSPGVSVDVINESFYSPNGPGTVPLIMVASGQNKRNPSGSVAEGTTKENAGKLFTITSKRELLHMFGTPTFRKTASGTSIFGSELSEYGLLTAHSVLDVSSRAYVMRADVDLNALGASSQQPSGPPAAGTIWFNTNTASWGVFEWSAETQTFTRKKPRVITSVDNLTAGVPKSSIGSIGEYAIVATNANNPLYVKSFDNEWILVGSQTWQESIPTINSTLANPTLTPGNSIRINTLTVTLSGSTVSALATSINNATIPGVSAFAEAGYLYIYADSTARSDGSTLDGRVAISNISGTLLASLGIVARTYRIPATQLSNHTNVPAWKSFEADSRPSGSIWIKTSAVANGSDLTTYKYNSSTERWSLQAAPLYANDQSAIRFLDPTRGGLGIALGAFYWQYDVNANNTGTYKLFSRARIGVTRAIGDANPTFINNNQFTIQASILGSSALTAVEVITISGTTVQDFVEAVLAAGITNVTAYVTEAGAPVIEHSTGGTLILKNQTGTPLTAAGITTSNVGVRAGLSGSLIVSNWDPVTDYVASNIAPVDKPEDGAMWYYGSPLEVDIMVNTGSAWRGYQNVSLDSRGYDLTVTDPTGPIISTSAPIAQTDGTALVYGDIWIDTSSLENYPTIYRWQSVGGENKWELLVNGDSSSENGIMFADARWDTDGTVAPVLEAKPSMLSLLTSDYTDLDAPDPTLYPKGILMFNTRRSSYNVKQYMENYFTNENFPLQIMPAISSTWVSISGNAPNGVPYFGRKAVRNVIVDAMQAAMDVSEELREDSKFFNLIVAPGYPELIPNMVALNNARRITGFVIGDMPMGLSSNATVLDNFLINSSDEFTDSENSLVTNDPWLAIAYPSACLTSDTTGSTVAMPSSHVVLRTYIRSDNSSYLWRAPAGSQRGVVDNATAMGYVERSTGRFIKVGTTEGLRDLLYINRVNPIVTFDGQGIMIYGQKTRAIDSSAVDRVNVSRLVAYLRLKIEQITKPFVFEPNDRITRNEIKQTIERELNDLVATRAVFDYLVVCDEVNNFPSRVDRSEIWVDIAIEPVKAAEFIYVPLRLKNTGEISAGNLSPTRDI